MNFLSLRSNSQNASSQQQKSDQENQAKPSTTLEGLIDEDPFPPTPSNNAGRDFNSKFGAAFSATSKVSGLENHVDVTEDQGWITIPNSMFRCSSKFCRYLMVILLVLFMWCYMVYGSCLFIVVLLVSYKLLLNCYFDEYWV